MGDDEPSCRQEADLSAAENELADDQDAGNAGVEVENSEPQSAWLEKSDD